MATIKPIELAFVVDDDEIYTFTLNKLMKIKNFAEQVMFFTNGKKALDFLSAMIESDKEVPDVILLDIEMPVMDGWQFMERFIEMKPKLSKEITIYIVSSSVYEEDIKKAKSFEEVSDYIIKPMTMTDLMNIMEEIQNKSV